MPSLQVVDTTRDKPDPTGVEEFFTRLGRDYKDYEDQLEIGKLIGDYQKNRQDANALEDLFMNIQKSTASPTKQLEAIQKIKAGREVVAERDKVFNAEAKRLEDISRKESEKQAKLQAEEAKKAKELEDKRIKSEKTKEEVREILLSGGENPEEAERLSAILTPSSASARVREKNAANKISNKENLKKQEEIEAKKITQKAYNDIVSLIPKAGFGTGFLSTFGGENAKTYGQFTSLTGALESLLVEKVNRGTLSNTRFKYITETLLPKPTDTRNEIKGKMAGLATILDLSDTELKKLDMSPKEIEEYKKKVQSDLQKVDQERPGFVKVKDPQGVERWVPEEVAKQLKG